MSGLARIELPARMIALGVLGVLVALTGATWFLLISPKRTESGSLESQIQIARATLQVGKNTASHPAPPSSEGLYVRRALPTAVAMPQVVLELSRVAAEEHVALTAITPSAPVPYSGFEAVPLSVVVTGRFFALEAFLQQIRDQVKVEQGAVQATGRLFDVQSLDLALSTTPPDISATLALDVFVYSPVAGLGGATSTTTTTASGAST